MFFLAFFFFSINVLSFVPGFQLSREFAQSFVSAYIKFVLRCRMAPKVVSMYYFQCSVVCL